MREKDQILFELLRQEIVAMMRQTYPGINPSIAEWKGQEITDFQEDLRIRVNANVSEKWFYTHMKSGRGTLPRIDMLNLLSRYAGYANWDEFVFRNGPAPADRAAVRQAAPSAFTSGVAANRYFVWIPLAAVFIVLGLWGIYSLFSTREYCFTFTDADTREIIVSEQTEVLLLNDGESPVRAGVGADGRCRVRTSASRIRMVVKAPRYLADTITRTLRKFSNEETIPLKADDYALMLHYLVTTKVGDWEMRRKRLGDLIGDSALICRVIRGQDGPAMALYGKQEFIDLLTMPSGSLKNIEILESRLKGEKIIVLRFIVREEKP